MDTSKVRFMKQMFYDCSSLVDLSGLDDWSASKVENMNSMFTNCSSLEDISALDNWNTPKLKSIESNEIEWFSILILLCAIAKGTWAELRLK